MPRPLPRLTIVLLSCLGLGSGCASPLGSVPEAVEAALRLDPSPTEAGSEAPLAEPRVRLEIRGDAVEAWLVRIRDYELPPRVARSVESILPSAEGASSRSTWRRLSADGERFSAERSYPSDPQAIARSVLVDDAGNILERTYPIATEASPEAVRDRLAAESLDAIEVVQGDGPDRYRATTDSGWVEFDESGAEVDRVRRTSIDLASR